MRRALFLFVALLASFESKTLSLNSSAHAQPAPSAQVREANMSTVGIAAGRTEGAPLRFAAELARVLDDDTRMRLLPIVTRGPFENVRDLLFLRGVDLAIVYGDVLDHYKKYPPLPDFEKRINYVMHLFPSEVHIFARPEIEKLEDLAGKPVNFNTKGTAAAYSGPLIFERLGIKIDARFDPHPTAMREMASGDAYAATVWVSTKPLDPFLKGQWPKGFKFLPLPLTTALEEYYLPAQLDAADYPALIPAGQSVPTVSVPAVLAAYAWPSDSERYRRVQRFIDYVVDRLPKLQSEAGFHPRWKDINLAATVPGWQRFPAMQAKLDALKRNAGTPVTAREPMPPAQAAATAPQQPVASGSSEADARNALARAGFLNVGPLKLDDRRFWVGTVSQGNESWRVAVDRAGVIYRRKLPNN